MILYVGFLSSVLCLFLLCGPLFASDAGSVAGQVLGDTKVPVALIFTSDTFDIPDDLANVVNGIVGTAVSTASSLRVVNQDVISKAGSSLGFSNSQLADVSNAAAAGKAAGVPFVLISKIDYDLEAAAKAYAMNEASKKAGGKLGGFLGKAAKPKEVKPTFNIQVVDTATSSVIFNNNAEVDVFTDDLKQQLISGALSGGSVLGAGALNLSPVSSLLSNLVPGISNAVASTSSALGLASSTENAEEEEEETTTTPAATTTTPARTNTAAYKSYENDSTDYETVIASYGLDEYTEHRLITKHKSASKLKTNKSKIKSYKSIISVYGDDYLAAYCIALAEFNDGDKSEALRWCERALDINEDYVPAQKLKAKIAK